MRKVRSVTRRERNQLVRRRAIAIDLVLVVLDSLGSLVDNLVGRDNIGSGGQNSLETRSSDVDIDTDTPESR